MENDRVDKRVYIGKCASIHSVGRPQKRWIDTVENCLRNRGLNVKQEEWCMIGVYGGFCEGDCMGHYSGNEPSTLTRYHSYKEALEG